ncbi:MAG TPA: CAP domain-containing protein [Spirochaetota bacterium]|nr:CAP domain-containing protein [Spirochaetota bacterium]HPH02114.1 CAP domain-containing protein [Spirochaetota bacterium]HPN81887.1 CAP domain-containing protein [Spirochaetota bacterium]
MTRTFALAVFCQLALATSLTAATTTLTVKSSQQATSYPPVWIEKGAQIRLDVSGSWSMWHPNWAPVDWRGHTFFNPGSGQHLGRLMASVEGGQPFPVTSGSVWTSTASGYLVLYPHRAKYAHLATTGTLTVRVSGYTHKPLVLSSEAKRVLEQYRNVYLESTITSLGWTGSISGCNAGTLPRSVLDKVLARINYFRSLTGLPPVRFTSERNTKAQHAALIMLANKQLSHYPDANWRCFSQAGKEGAGSSNLGLTTLDRIITEFIEDPGSNNAPCGHRRWVLYSGASEFGFGAAHDKSHYTFAAEALHVSGNRQAISNLPEFIAWPPKGYIPDPLFFPRGSFSIPKPASAVKLAGARVRMQGSDGSSITVRLNPVSQYGDPGITWEILPANENLEGFRLKWRNKPIHVFIDGITVDGAPKSWQYTTTMLAP